MHNPKNVQKFELRHWAQKMRSSLSLAAISRQIVVQLEGLEVFQEARSIALYQPLGGELDLTSLIAAYPEKTWLLPRLDKEANPAAPEGQLCFHRYQVGDPLVRHHYGMEEPEKTSPRWQEKIEVMALPGLAFDKKGYRLGYGKGYYDRFLASLEAPQRPTCVGAVPEALLLPALPTDPWDIPVDIVVTEKQTLFPARP